MKNHHNARYPFLWVQTTEESRIIRENRENIEESVQFFSWDISAGWQVYVKNGEGWLWAPVEVPPKKGGQPSPPKDALAAIRQPPFPENSIFFLKDYHEYFKKITVVREAINLKEDLKRTARTVVFLSASSQIPVELQNDITILDYPYPDEPALRRVLEKIAEDNEEPLPPTSEITDTIVNAMRGLTWEGAENALALSLVTKNCFDVKTILDQKAAQLKAGSILEYGNFRERLAEIYGLERMKTFIMKTIGNPKARGVLIYGVPGTAKSHTAKAIANEMGWPCLIFRPSALKDKFQGVAEGRLHESFKTRRAFGNNVTFTDEIEAIATGISSGGDSGVGMTLFKDLLVEMEDSRGTGTYWIATCNDLEPLIHESGGAILRRFDAIFFCDMPTKEQAKGIARIWSNKEKVNIPEDFNFDGYTGANIASLAEKMSMMDCSAKEASEYILPYGHAHADELDEIRKKAKGVCIWANDPEDGEPKPSLRQVKR